MAMPPERRRRASARGIGGARRQRTPLAPLPFQRIRSRRRLRLRAVGLTSLVLAGFIASGAAGVAAYYWSSVRTALAITGQQASLSPTAAVAAAASAGAPGTPAATGSNAPFTVLLLGSDDDAKFQSDQLLTQSMILVRVVPDTKQVTMMSIPRDLWVPINGAGDGKIMTAYAYGGPAAAIRTVQANFNVHIDHYVWIGLHGLVNLIDNVGGIDVVVSNPVVDDYYPGDLAGNDPYAYERVSVLPGPQHLDGLHAMEYVRSRHGDLREDFGRSDRQQQVLLALRSKAKGLNAFDIPTITAALSGELLTDMSLPQIRDLLPLAGGVDPQTVQRITLLPPYTQSSTVGQADVVLPVWSQLRPLVAATFPS